MGLCDVIPGVSGGTIAFITGIYERLIAAISQWSFLPKQAWLRLRSSSPRAKKLWTRYLKSLDVIFLVSLFLGIALAIIFGSKLVLYLLDTYFAYTIAFFVGLILASAIFIFTEIKVRDARSYLGMGVGLLIGLVIAFIVPVSVNPTLFYLLLAGFLAVSALFLPGISGSFILLLLGVYEFMLETIHMLGSRLKEFGVFALGALAGVIVISRVVSYLFAKDRSRTLAVLLGLVVGSLALPLRRLVAAQGSLFLIILFAVCGALLVLLVHKLSRQ